MRHPPGYLLLENVVGFEVSETHAEMLEITESAGYLTQVGSFPVHLGILPAGVCAFGDHPPPPLLPRAESKAG